MLWHYSESIDCRAESREHHMTTGTCTKEESHTHSLCLSFHILVVSNEKQKKKQGGGIVHWMCVVL